MSDPDLAYEAEAGARAHDAFLGALTGVEVYGIRSGRFRPVRGPREWRVYPLPARIPLNNVKDNTAGIGYPVSATTKGGTDMKYLLNWNDEYLDMQIAGGPLADYAAAKKTMEETVVGRLVSLGMACDEKAAKKMYLAAAEGSPEGELEELRVSAFGASIMYAGYEDRYQIVDRDPLMAPMGKARFKGSGFIDGMFFRETGGFIEMYRIGGDAYPDGCRGYFLNHGLARFCDINLPELLENFDAKDIAGLKAELGQNWERDAVLAWFDMECRPGGGADRVNLTPFGTYEEAFRMMCLLSGYQKENEKDKKDKKEGEGLEISRTLTISTAHIRSQTARMMDMGAIHAGFYSAGEFGYHILTVGWEDYSDVMHGDAIPDDLKACVKFAAKHGCDWLCLDTDARTVPDLPVYEWD